MKEMRKGFTLIELIATIAILGVVVALSIYISMNVIGKSKNKSYQITINNIEQNAISYLNENSGKLFFVSGGNQKEYQCITVGNLVDMGYFDENITESKISNDKTVGLNDYIYLERNSESKTVTKSVYLNPNLDNYSNVCGVSINASGDIRFVVTPSTGFSKSKDVTIYYRVKNGLNINDYQNNYQYENLSGQIIANEEDVESSTKVTVTENGTMYAEIEGVVNASQVISGIDNEGPVITTNYNGNNTNARGSLTIPLKLSDVGIGVDYDSLTIDDVKVFVGGIEITATTGDVTTPTKQLIATNSIGEYNVVIKNNTLDGEVVVKIDKDTVFDKLDNGNKETLIDDLKVSFRNVYTITFNANGGTPSVSKLEKRYNEKIGTFPSVKRDGYTFLGWYTEKSAGSKISTSQLINSDVTYYAHWRQNTVTIKYNVNSGILTSSTQNKAGTTTYSWKSDSSGLVYKDSSILTYTIKYGKTITSSGLVDYDNENYLYITKKGYEAVSGNQWKCLSGNCTKTTYSQASNTNYTASDFCDATVTDCEVVLGVNWEAKTYTISYNANGGSGAPSSDTVVYGSKYTISTTKPTWAGHTFLGWTTKSDGTDDKYNWTGWSGTWTYDNGEWGIANNKLVLYARWQINTVTIKYNVNSGILTSSTQNKAGTTTYSWKSDSSGLVYKDSSILTHTIKYGKTITSSGLVDYDNENYLYITKKGYKAVSGNQWKCLSGNCAKTTYSQASNTNYIASDFCDATVTDCEVVLGVNWEAKTYTISYNANGGSGSMSNTSCTYDSKCTISQNSFTRLGYKFVGWTTKSDGTDDKYNWTGWSGTWIYDNGEWGIASNKLVLYARWEPITYTINYYTYDGKTKLGSSTHTYDEAKKLTTITSLSGSAPNSNVTFYGWATSANATTRKYSDGASVSNLTTTASESINLYAIWRSSAVKITYKSGVNMATSTTSSSYYYYNNATSVSIKIGTPSGITNWSTLGWRNDTTAGNLEYKNNTSYNFSTSTTLYAVYSRKLTISYNGNGATSGSTTSTTKTIYLNTNSTTTSSQAVTLAANGFTKTGNKFSKWAVGSSSGTQYAASASYNPGLSYNAATFGKTMFAVWTPYVINVQFHMNGGKLGTTTSSHISTSGDYITYDGSKNVKTYNYGSTDIDLPNPDYRGYINIKKDGYSPIAGKEWNSKSDGGGTSFSDSGGVNSANLCDASNGDCTATLYVNWKDSEAPTCTISGNPSSWTNSDVTLTVSGSDNSGALAISAYSWTSNSSGFGTTKTKTVSTNGTYTAYVKDAAGNVGSCSVTVSKIDKTAPTCTISGNPSSWTNSDVTLTVSGSDNSETLASSAYSWTSKSSGFGTTKIKTVSANGTYTAYVKDAAGNVGSCSVTVSKIDKTAPTCRLSVTTSGISFDSKSDNVEVTSYGINTSTTPSYSSSSASLSKGTFYGHVKDAAGNIGSCSATLTGTEVSKWTATYKTCNRKASSYTCRTDASLEKYCSDGYADCSYATYPSNCQCYYRSAATKNYYCSTGYYPCTSGNCECYSYTKASKSYYCPNGYYPCSSGYNCYCYTSNSNYLSGNKCTYGTYQTSPWKSCFFYSYYAGYNYYCSSGTNGGDGYCYYYRDYAGYTTSCPNGGTVAADYCYYFKDYSTKYTCSSGTLSGSSCYKYKQSSCGSWSVDSTNWSYYFSTSSGTVSSCPTGNSTSFTCDTYSEVGDYYTSSCTPKEYKCSTGTKLDDKYCYVIN